ncbi:hypothetical protein [Mesorhizobium sp. M00.F.Ca.ET.216.01.1.1]|uniref:hypothetical protein n=1 Tax=Mesorhizobium sp. M00.F.Ca.ET.216.01.1.1 TaxID=2500528 RepID=UPI001FE1D50B|nr:hypothetical protein [Mesorhizobium sp. M00.F.Ca.ET.216.01.1.1]
MSRIGIHSFVWSSSSAQGDLERTLANTKEAGFDLIEFSYLDPANVDIGRLAKRIADLDLGVAISIGLPADGDISSADKTIAARGIEILNNTIAFTRDLGGRKVAGILCTSHGLQAQAPTRDHRLAVIIATISLQAFRPLASSTASSGARAAPSVGSAGETLRRPNDNPLKRMDLLKPYEHTVGRARSG